MNAPLRLLSPSHRRIYPNPMASHKGEGDLLTFECLSKAGWQRYDGPAQTDERGYVIPESDPKLKPTSPSVKDPRWDGLR